MSTKLRDHVVFYINHKRVELRGAAVFKTLAEFLREDRGLSGTKIVCAEGDCGACTVLRASPRPLSKKVGSQKQEWSLSAINSCIALVGQMDGTQILTVEGLREGEALHATQESMIEHHGSQCGYCTPGFVVAMAGMLEHSHSKKETADLETRAKNYLTGNLCRCTGYQPIIEAAKHLKNVPSLKDRYLSAEVVRDLASLRRKSVQIQAGQMLFLAPANEKDLKVSRKRHPTSLIVGAASDLGVQHNKGLRKLEALFSLHLMDSWDHLEFLGGEVKVGARVPLSRLRSFLKNRAPEVAAALDVFASPQIKNVATLAGNIANASPVADMSPMLLALDATVEILNPIKNKKRILPLREFFVAYKKTALERGELLTKVSFRLPRAGELFRFYKCSQRRDLDISTVNAAFWVKKNKKGFVSDVRVALGGVAPVPKRLHDFEKTLSASAGDPSAWKAPATLASLQEAIQPISDLRGSSAYRRLVAQNFFVKFVELLA